MGLKCAETSNYAAPTHPMLGIHRINGERARLVLGHMIYDDCALELAFDTALALRKCFVEGPGLISIVRPGRKISFEQDGTTLLLRNGEGPAPTVWQTQMPMPEFHAWLAQFLFLVDLDTWERETLPKYRAQLIPMRVQTEWTKGRPKWADATIGKGKRARSVWRNPPVKESPQQYSAAWMFLQSLGRVPPGSPPEGYDAIVERLAREGIDPRKDRVVD